jgi:hypothetical protein
MDLRKILARKHHQLETLEAQLGVLRDEVATLDRALEIATREEGNDTDVAVGRAARDTPIEGASAHDRMIDPAPAKREPLHVVSATEQRPTGRLIGMIREIVQGLPEPFSTADIRNEIKRRDPSFYETIHYSSISGTMRRMTGKELVAVEKGGPGKEATYRRVNNLQPRPEHRTDEQATIGGERELVESAR